LKIGSDPYFVTVTTPVAVRSVAEKDALAEQAEARTAVHLAFEHLEQVDVASEFTPGGQDALVERATVAVEATRWLISQRFPATEPLDIVRPPRNALVLS
jgi:hypothetical protein